MGERGGGGLPVGVPSSCLGVVKMSNILVDRVEKGKQVTPPMNGGGNPHGRCSRYRQ